jgi:hypothetical protein
MRTQGEQGALIKVAREASAALKKFDDEVLLTSNRPNFNKANADSRLLKLRNKKKELTDTSTETIDVLLLPSTTLTPTAPKKPEAAEYVDAPDVKTATQPEARLIVEAPLIIETP